MPFVIGFVGRLATQKGMRSPLVIPFHEASERGPEIPASQWDVKQSCVLVLESADEAFAKLQSAERVSILVAGTVAEDAKAELARRGVPVQAHYSF